LSSDSTERTASSLLSSTPASKILTWLLSFFIMVVNGLALERLLSGEEVELPMLSKWIKEVPFIEGLRGEVTFWNPS